MSKMFFTSDLHLGHVRAATGFRNFGTVEEHNAFLVARWNEVVGDDDIVYVLGDLCMGSLEKTLPVAGELKGIKFLVPGNHDRMHPGHHNFKIERKAEWIEKYSDLAGFTTMARMLTFERGDIDITACHFPFSDDHEEYADQPRYPEFRPVDTGTNYIMHGHIHDMRRESEDCRQVNVGVDVWDFRPVQFEIVCEVMGL
jgi:calcineurin-like phosphoesterase family protein